MGGRRTGLLALFFLGGLLTPPGALAEVYRWVDQRGIVHYSEGIDSIPRRFRSSAEPVFFPKPPAPEKDESGGPPATSVEPGEKATGENPAAPAEPQKSKGSEG